MRTIISVCILISFSLVSCSIFEEPIENKWKDMLVRSWELSDYTIFWEVSEEDPAYACRSNVSNRYVEDKDVSENPVFNLVFHRDKTYELNYSIPLEPVILFCNDQEYEVEQPNRTRILEGTDYGNYSLRFTPGRSIFRLETLSSITFDSKTDKTYGQKSRPILYEASGVHHLHLKWSSFEELYTFYVYLISY